MATLSKKDLRKASKGKGKAPAPLYTKSALKKPAVPPQQLDEEEDEDDQDWTDDGEELLDDGDDDDDDDEEDLLDDEEDSGVSQSGESDKVDSEDEDSDNGGVSEKGLQRLMELVGEDDLDEFDKARLGMTDVDGDEDEDEDEEAENKEGDELSAGVGGEEDAELSEQEDEVSEEAEINLDDVDSDISMEDAVTVQKVITDNRPAMKLLRDQISVTSLPWREHLTLSSKEAITIDPSDDLQREMAFYKIALDQVAVARKLCSKHDIPFSRPNDYYAEMVKSDEHMERVRTKLVDEATGIKKSEAAKKQRDLKKFGKQIQQEKLKQREMDKKSFNERMHGIKRKRKEGMDLGDEDDDFDISVDEAADGAGQGQRGRGGVKGKMPRHARDAKYSLGGGGRRSKQNTKESAHDIPGWGMPGKGKGGAKGSKGQPKGGRNRPGKARRKAGRA